MVRDHGYHAVTVARVVPETADAASIVLDLAADQRDAFAYEPGQFITFKVETDGEAHHRCYSMSSTPGIDDELQVTVKRVPGGVVSNWLLDHLEAGSKVEVTYPAGVFGLAAGDGPVVGFAGGSGITPVLSMAKAALAGGRRVRLLYANRDAESVIFADALDALVAQHGGRLEVVHRHDVDHGYVDAAAVRAFLGDGLDPDAGFYLCGPTPFMDVVEASLLEAGVTTDRIHVERFTPAAPSEPVAEADAADGVGSDGVPQLTIDVDGKVASGPHHAGSTILQMARSLGLSPPYSCETGSCATCMARLTEGTATMRRNDALTDDEVAEGWVLTCQAEPTSATLNVVYGY